MFRELIDAIPDALIVLDGSGHVVQANAHASRLFGYAPKALIGLGIDELLRSDVPSPARGNLAWSLPDLHVRQSLMGLRADGSEFPVEVALNPVDTAQGERYLASIRDIAETERARQALVRANYDAAVARFGQIALESGLESDVLGQIPALLADLLGNAAVAVGFVSSDGRRIDLQASIGMDADTIAPWLDLDGGPIGPHLAGGTAWVVDGVGADAGTAAFVPLLDRSRAMGVLLAVSHGPRVFDHDALHLMQSVANMVSAVMQRRRTEEQLAHAQRLDAIGQLTGGIAHDFNNLLTVLSGSLQLLAEDVDGNAEATDLIESALRSVGRGAELTGKLLAFARRQQLAPEPVHLGALLDDLRRMLERTLGDSVHLHVRCPASLPPAFIDPVQLDAALVNLALNARDAMPLGGEIGIEASERIVAEDGDIADLAAGHYIVLTVFDTGHGMPPETLARALEPFFTTKDSGRGSGLGLSMVYGFIKQSGGHMTIASSLGYGARVVLYLPASIAPAASKSTAAHGASAVAARAGETILVVEDDAAVRAITVAFLRRSGYTVVTASSGADALVQIDAHPGMALLFSDVRLGDGISGRDVARFARRRFPSLPILLTSGFENNAAATDDGDAHELLRKPYRREQLASAVRRLLDARVDGGR